MSFPTENQVGSTIDWGQAWIQHRGWLATVIRSRLADREAAEDVLQEVAVAAIGQRTRPTDPSKVAPWLYRVALRKVINHHRATGRQRRLLEGAIRAGRGDEHVKELEPGAWMIKGEETHTVVSGLQHIDPQDRQLLLLKYTEGWGYQELSDHLGISLKTVEYRLLKARRALRASIQSTL
jgi:RNA polymerase sigma-70 factor (ECF subfamily)